MLNFLKKIIYKHNKSEVDVFDPYSFFSFASYNNNQPRYYTKCYSLLDNYIKYKKRKYYI